MNNVDAVLPSTLYFGWECRHANYAINQAIYINRYKQRANVNLEKGAINSQQELYSFTLREGKREKDTDMMRYVQLPY